MRENQSRNDGGEEEEEERSQLVLRENMGRAYPLCLVLFRGFRDESNHRSHVGTIPTSSMDRTVCQAGLRGCAI